MRRFTLHKQTRNCLILVIGLLMLCVSAFYNQSAQAVSDNITYPTFGLYCAEYDGVLSGNVKFNLTDSDLFSKQKAVKEFEYIVSGNQSVVFEIPFFSAYTNMPQFSVNINGQAVKGEVWYGDNQIYYGENTSYLRADSMNNTVLEFKLKRTYSPELDDSVMGTLYTITPDADNITVSMKLSENCCYVYDNANRRTEIYSPDKTRKYIYENALSKASYQYFFVGENSVIDFSTTCEYQTEQISFKEFICRNYNSNKDFYEKIGAPIECIYAIANRLLADKGGIAYSELFSDSFDRVALNSYKFTVPNSGIATVKYSSVVDMQAIIGNDRTVYAVAQKQIGNYITDYSVTVSNKTGYAIQSNREMIKSGSVYTASATDNFYFVCSPQDSVKSAPSKTQLIVYIVCGVVGSISTIIAVICIIIFIRAIRNRNNKDI